MTDVSDVTFHIKISSLLALSYTSMGRMSDWFVAVTRPSSARLVC